jgi:predicted AlkP superfamily phosphohydrolase/phosphomutase
MSRRAGLLPTCLLVSLLLPGCNEKPPGRALLVGIDGASMRVVGPMLEDGRLPNLAALAVSGVHGTIRSQFPIDSPPVWNSIVTGVSPKRHGIPSFAYKDEQGEKRLFLSTHRKVPTVWNILSAAGFSVGVVNFWNTYPPDRVKGVMISDHVLAREVDGRALISHAEAPAPGTTVYPEAWADRIDTLLDVQTPLTAIANPFRNNQALPKWVLKHDLIRRYEEDGALARIALAIEQELRPDLLMLLLPGVDRVSHHLWGNLEPPEKYPPRLRPDREARAAGLAALQDYYRYVDAILGLLLENFGPDDLVMVLSDHGFEAGTALMYLTGKHESEAALDGIFFARAPGIESPGGGPGTIGVRDVTPTLLAWFGVPVGEDMQGTAMPFLESSRRAETIASHRDTPIEKVTDVASGVEGDIIERLRMIGYLEEPGADKPAESSAGAPPE